MRQLFIIAFCIVLASSALADVTIHCLDVGQGDATLIVSSSGQTMLFDGGWNGEGDDVIIPYMNSLGLGELTYMAASHYHADHCGGLDEVFDEKGVSVAVYDRGWSYTTQTYTSYANTVASKRVTINDNQVIDMGDGVTVTCIAVNGNGELSPPYDSSSYENEYCLALLVECGDFDFFVAGDLTGGGGSYRDIETSVGPEAGDLEVYHVSHHGSYSSSNPAFMAATTPEVSIISVGDGNSYGHPHQDVLNRLYAMGSSIYQTETGDPSNSVPGRVIVNGHIVITTDGTGTYDVHGDQYEMDEAEPSAVIVQGLQLLGNFPNPFNPSTEIRFTTSVAGLVDLTVYDLAGRIVWQERDDFPSGLCSINWNGKDSSGIKVSSGNYFYRISSADGSQSDLMTLVK